MIEICFSKNNKKRTDQANTGKTFGYPKRFSQSIHKFVANLSLCSSTAITRLKKVFNRFGQMVSFTFLAGL